MSENCPSGDMLLAFHLGTLPQADVEAVATHLESCPTCEARLDQFDVTGDALLSGLRRPVPPAPSHREDTREHIEEIPAAWPGISGYRHIGALGRGGMGVVFEAEQIKLSRRVAVKRLSTRGGGDRSRAEAETLAQLVHPNIVQVYEILETDTGIYLILELVDRGSLDSHLRGRPVSPRETAPFVETIARAVHHAHTRGIIHRDLKPANILLAALPEAHHFAGGFRPSSYTPKVADFGIAKRLDVDSGHTREGDVIGTPNYMAPEQAGGNQELIGPRTDVYSLGVILYELLTGRVPLQGPTTLDTLLMVRTEEPVPPRRLQPGIPRDLETICLKCLLKEPARRYDSAEALAADLRRFQEGKPVLARRTTVWERAWKWAKREPRVASLSAALLLVIVAGWSIIAWRWQAESVAKRQAQENERKADRLSADFALDHGIALADEGKLSHGLLWMVRSLELAVRSGDADLERAIRYNLAVWPAYMATPGPEFPHTNWVWAVAWSPDGTKVLTGSADRTARIWDAKSGTPVGDAFTLEAPVWAVAWSPDGSKILTGSGRQSAKEGRIRIWDAATHQLLASPISVAGPPKSVSFSPDGQRFLTVCRDEARLWRTANAAPIGSPFINFPVAGPAPGEHAGLTAAISPDGNLVATAGDDGLIRLWDPTTGNATGTPLRASAPILDLAFSPAGGLLLTGSADGVAQLWDLRTGLARGPALRHRGRVRAVAFNGDGQLIATAAMAEDFVSAPANYRGFGGEVQIWQTRTGWRLGPPLWHSQPVWSIAFSPDSRILITGSQDAGARFFLTATGGQMGEALPQEGTVTNVAFRHDGTAALASSAGGDQFAAARIWLPPAGLGRGRPHFQEAELLALLFTPDGNHLLATTNDGGIHLLDSDGRAITDGAFLPKYATALALRPDGTGYLVADENGRLQLRDLMGGQARYTLNSGSWINALAFSPDGCTYLVGDRGGQVWHRDTATGKPLGDPIQIDKVVWRLQFTSDGKQFLVGTDKSVGLWNLDSRTVVHSAYLNAEVTQLALTPSEKAAVIVVDGFAREWRFGTDGEMATAPYRADGGIDRLAFSADGRSVLISGMDGNARLWDVATGKPLGPTLGSRVRPVVFSHKSGRMAVGDRDGRLFTEELAEPVTGSPAQVRLWIEARTRMELDAAGAVRKLNAEEVDARRRKLDAASHQ